MSLTFPIDAKLKDGSSVQLVLADQHDVEPPRSLYKIIVDEGTSDPHDQFLLVSRQGRGVSSDSFIFCME
jgi:hypothetical protein